MCNDDKLINTHHFVSQKNNLDEFYLLRQYFPQTTAYLHIVYLCCVFSNLSNCLVAENFVNSFDVTDTNDEELPDFTDTFLRWSNYLGESTL